MESLRRRLVLIISSVVIVGLAFHAPATVWVSTHVPKLALIAKSWKEVLLLIICLVLVWHISVAGQWQKVFRDKIVQLVTLYGVIHGLFVVGLYFATAKTLAAGLEIDLRGVLVFLEFYVATKFYWPELRSWVVRSAAVNAVVVGGFAFLQLFLPKDILKHLGYSAETIRPYLTVDKAPGLFRENSTLRGPNPLGAYGASGILFAQQFWQRHQLGQKAKYGLAALIICFIVALVMSFSRSAWLGFVVAVIIGTAFYMRQRIPRGVWIGGAVVIFAIAGGLLAARENPTISTIVFHDNPEGSMTKSDQQHEASLRKGIAAIATHPFGFGIGSAGSASLLGPHPNIVENQYLFVAYETGWAGLAVFIWLFALVLVEAYRKRRDWLASGVFLSGIVLAIVGLTLPVFADDIVSILWWGLAGIALGSATIKPHGRAKSSHKKAARNA